MENILRRLFDFQQFEGNADLQSIVDSVHAKYAVRELNLDELEFAAAAGIPETAPDKKRPEEKKW